MKSLTFNSLSKGGKWGNPRTPINYVPASISAEPVNWKERKEGLGDPTSFVFMVEKLAKEQMAKRFEAAFTDKRVDDDGEAKIDRPGGRAILRAYLDMINAAEALEQAEYNGSELDLGLIEMSWEKSTTAATSACFLISLLAAIVFVGIAVLMSMWGFDVNGVAMKNITAIDAYSGGVRVSTSGETTCSVEAQDSFKIDKFLGYPEADVFWNLYGGLVLGLIFGFLDNFGLFYGMGALDAFFYNFGATVAAGLMNFFRKTPIEATDSVLVLRDLHTVTSDLMAGLGNTFSGLSAHLTYALLLALTVNGVCLQTS